jgi:hypothetical protein
MDFKNDCEYYKNLKCELSSMKAPEDLPPDPVLSQVSEINGNIICEKSKMISDGCPKVCEAYELDSDGK